MVRIVLTFLVILCSFVTPVFSEETTVSATEKAYVLVAVDAKGENTITKFEMIDGVMTPKYYRVDLAKTEYGKGDTNKYFEWTKNAYGEDKFKEVSSPTEGKITITGVYDSKVTQQSRFLNSNDILSKPIEGNFVGNYVSSSSASVYGGAIYNERTIGYITGDEGTIGDITGDFIGNYVSSSAASAHGGAIYNSGGTIGDITGDFIGNYVSSSSASAHGGAIYNRGETEGLIRGGGTIGNITGDFIGNYASSSSASAYGGAIYNNGGEIGYITGDEGIIGDIIGDFIGNYASASSASYVSSAYGGAIYNRGGTISNITGDFIGNYASALDAYGGAIYNIGGTIGNITGDFIGNYASALDVYGGAIYNSGGTIYNITGDFIGNYASASTSGSAHGGAIYNEGAICDITGDFIGNYASAAASTFGSAYGGAIDNEGTIYTITGDFIGNYASASSAAYGGAIYNSDGTIYNITGDFIGNYAYASSSTSASSSSVFFARGGAIYNAGLITGYIITADFIGNYAYASSSTSTSAVAAYAHGGAIYNTGIIDNITGDFIGNYASGSSASTFGSAYGGAIDNKGTIYTITGDFIGNYASGSSASTFGSAYGGAIYSEREIGNIAGDFIGNYASASSAAYGGAIYNEGWIGGITNSNFINNYAKAESTDANAKALGGAIWTNSGLSIIADNGSSVFSGNKTITTINKGSSNETTTETQNAIWVDDKTATLTLKSVNNGTIQFDDNIDGVVGYGLNLTGDSTGKILFNKDIINANVTVDNVNLRLGNDSVLDKSKSLTLNSGSLDLQNNKASSIAIPEVIVNGTINTKIDADLSSTGKIDNFVNTKLTGSGTISIDSINIVKDMEANVSSAVYDFIKRESSVSFDLNVPDSTIITSSYTYYFGINDDKQIVFEKASDLGGFAAAVVDSSENVDYFITVDKETLNGYSILSGNGQQSKNLSIQGNGNVLDGNGYDGVLVATDKTLNIQDVGKYNEEKPEESSGWSGFKNSAIRNNGNLNIKNSVFVGNTSEKGGAIYTTGDVTIVAENGTTYFGGNKMVTVEGVGTADEKMTETSSAIYVDSATAKVTLDAKDNGIIVLDDQIDGKKGFALKLTGDETGQIDLNNNVLNADVTLEKTNLNLGKDDLLNNVQSLKLSSGTLSMVNDSVGMMHVPIFNLAGSSNFAADVDLANKSMDRIIADNYNIASDAKFNVTYLNILNDAKDYKTDILFAESGLAANVNYTGISPVAYSPLYKYAVSYDPTNGMFSFTGGPSSSSDSYNPSVLAPAVATQAGAYTTQLQTFNYAFQHSDTFMTIPAVERIAIRDRNKYALSPTGDAGDVGNFSPLFMKDESAGFWVKPYASFESIPLKNGPKVSNINYGTLVGYDTALKSTKFGFDRVITGYVGYNGASQRYSGVDTYQNGGILGTTFTFYKNNFFNATTVSVGASAGNSNNMYGSENYTMLLGGIGNKSGYNFEFKEGKFIIQPSMLISYTFVNTFDYRNAAGLSIKSDPLNAIQLAPGIKFIANTKNGWQPYVGISMVWNVLDNSKVMANDVRLPEMSIRPYVQYGIGAQKRFGERLTGYLQAMMHNGGRNGISLSGGMRWRI